MPQDVDPSDEASLDDEIRALDAARAALYRPGADDGVRRRYAELAERVAARRAPEQSTAEGPNAAGRGRGARRTVLAVTAVVVVAVGVILLAALVVPRSVAVGMTPLRMVGATDPTAEEAAVLSLFAGSFAAQNKLALRAVVDPPPALASGGVQRSAVRRIDGTGTLSVPQGTRSGTVSVVVLCTTATAFRWRLTVAEEGRSRVLATSSSGTCLGTASYATARIAAKRRATLRFTAGSGRQALVALVGVPDAP